MALDVQYFIASAITPGDRYDDVTIPSTDVDGVEFKRIGHWEYIAYEQTNNTNSDPENAAVIGVLERGRAYITGTSSFSYVENSNPLTYTTNE